MRVLSVVGCLLSGALACAQESHIPLHDGWTFCQVGKEQWYSAEVPGVVQTDLLHHGLIPDFYKGSNIDSVQWIENEDWIYKRTIVANDSLLKNGHVDLVFKGLDTFAEVYLNDSLLGKADNMFRTWEWPIKEALRPGTNELKVIFRSPIKEGAKLRDAYGIQLPHDNDPSGVSPYIRKAAYQFGWDFCPRLVTSGIWRSVELVCKGRAYVSMLPVGIDAASSGSFDAGGYLVAEENERATFRLFASDSLVASKRIRTAPRGIGVESPATGWVDFRSRALAHWYPNGSGAQNMMDVRGELTLKDGSFSTLTNRVFLDSISFRQAVDPSGRSFQFDLNGQPLFIKGCNLIPPSLIPSVPDSVWVGLVDAMRTSGMNMVRVWAGGYYPPDAFYDACDRAGIMVWLDLMFANMVPYSTGFLENVKAEVQELVDQTWQHPSVVFFCGNNELDVAWKNWGWQERYILHGADSAKVENGNWIFFNIELPKMFDYKQTPFLPTSPLSNWGNAEGLKSGDLHYWGVWHGDSAFSSFKNNVGRFVSEYGFQSYPDSALLSHYIDPKELYLGSPTMKRLQRSYKTDKPIWDAIKRELGKPQGPDSSGEPKTLGEFIEASQEVQAKAYRMAIEAHMAAQPHCMGTLFWQLNDCWPGPSWSLIDYEGNWKPGMYEVQRLYKAE